MVRLEDDVLEDFFHRLDQDKLVSSTASDALRQLLSDGAVPKGDQIVTLIEMAQEESPT